MVSRIRFVGRKRLKNNRGRSRGKFCNTVGFATEGEVEMSEICSAERGVSLKRGVNPNP